MAKYNPKIGDPEEWGPASKLETPSVEEFVPLEGSDLFLPRPTGKECRQLIFKGGMALNVEETQEQLREAIGELARRGDGWLHVTDGQFGNKVSIPSNTALDELLWVAEGWIDVAGAREQQKQREMAQRLQASCVVRAELVPMARSNGKRR